MRPVNLLPEGARRGGTGSGFASYVVLGVLALAVVLVTVSTVADRRLAEKRTELAQTRAQADAAEARASKLAHYTAFADLRAKRVETVRSLARSRFDWATSLHEVARTIPAEASLRSLRGTVQPGVSVDGESDPLRSALPVPAVELKGCTASQRSVARMMAAMRRIDGVQRVSLSSSQKAESGSGQEGSCSSGAPSFSMTVFFAAPAADTAAAGAAPDATAAAAATTTTDGAQK